MTKTLPTHRVEPRPTHWSLSDGYAQWPWREVAPLPPFIRVDNSGPAHQQTTVRLVYDRDHLYVRFDCADSDIWGVETARDSHIFNEEVVELFIAPGDAIPVDYFEFEVSPLGTLLDLTVHNPSGERSSLRTDFAWDCPGLQWSAVRDDSANRWHAYLVVPWRSLGVEGALPRLWRANFYRIERPRGASAEFSCWSPTLTDPPNYHVPARFGTLELVGPS